VRRQAFWRPAVALVVTAIAFAGGFAAARVLDGDGNGDAEPTATSVRELPRRLVTINNLERAPSIKPLRSIAGAPEPTQVSPSP